MATAPRFLVLQPLLRKVIQVQNIEVMSLPIQNVYLNEKRILHLQVHLKNKSYAGTVFNALFLSSSRMSSGDFAECSRSKVKTRLGTTKLE